ncbi:CRISPR-associated endonuclease Cas3'' [Streptomyces sp. NPDC048172]|uniref:CRISPR-associated endonuclease Cas3'' n=1 Tax=Streptomyces sp. NPDC048172 TaxID=3365505 RepID=UPI00371F592A
MHRSVVPWGKVGPRRGAVPHALMCHALDTAAVAELIGRTLCRGDAGRRLYRMLEPVGDPELWVPALCGLHDLGKYAPTFQALRFDAARGRFSPGAQRDMRRLLRHAPREVRTDVHHGWVTAVHLRELLERWGARPGVARDLAVVLGGHHGVIPTASVLQGCAHALSEIGGLRWREGRDAFVGDFLEAWGLEDPAGRWSEVVSDPVALVALAGLTTTSDWIASDRRKLAPMPNPADLRAYAAQARTQEAEKMGRLLWEAWEPPGEASFGELFPGFTQGNPVQRAVERLAGAVREPGIMVIAAPTGSGKTEAGLQAAARMVRSLELAGFYVAMPTRATSNQTFHAAKALLERTGATSPLGLLHSSAREVLAEAGSNEAQSEVVHCEQVNADPAEGTVRTKKRSGEGDQDKVARAWFAQRNRGLLAPTGVGTIDQLMLGALRRRFNYLALAGVSGRVVVFDEVHTYDDFQYVRLEQLLRWLGHLRVPVVLQSATLSSDHTEELVSCWVEGAQTATSQALSPDRVRQQLRVPRHYPRVFWVGAEPSDLRVEEVEQGEGEKDGHERVYRFHRPETGGRDAWEERADLALEAATSQNQCVAVFHNIVRQTQEAHAAGGQRIRARAEWADVENHLFHAKLTPDKRSAADQRIRAAFGPPRDEAGSRPQRAVVFGSPLLAEGLDLDFDAALVTLGPLDRMLQAMGRVRRHTREGRNLAEPVPITLIGVEERTETVRGRTRVTVHFPGWKPQVAPEALLLRTWAVLRERTEIRPQDTQYLIDQVYGPEDAVCCPPGWEKQWQRAHRAWRKRRAGLRSRALPNLIPYPVSSGWLEDLTRRPGVWRGTRLSQGPEPGS